ncbi:hypothetical protein BURK2_01466 [Burkholderiales bacterium]|nr:hypothetical protein BURK2_01466 [Burkholderiales bacterium]
MPTARELLEQADALMRRNRNAAGEDVPVLTEVVPAAPPFEDDEAVPVLTAVVEEVVAAAAPDWDDNDPSGIDIDADLAAMGPDFPTVSPEQLPRETEPAVAAARADGRLPMLEIPPETHHYRLDPVGTPGPGARDESRSKVNSGISGEMLEKTLPLSELLASPAAQTVDAKFFDIPPGGAMVIPAPASGSNAASTASAVAPEPAPVKEAPKPLVDLDLVARELTEQITLQVLQKLDIYTERGMQEHLAQHLKPVVERAVGELVTTINANVGRVVRAFVAESIEREIEHFRREIADNVKRAHPPR